MMTTVTTATALRREVCALLYLALLCCFASMCVTAAVETEAVVKSERLHSGASAVNVSVEISCVESNNPLKWRFPDQTNWTKCAHPQGAYDYNVEPDSTGDYTVSASEGYDVDGTPDEVTVVLLDSPSVEPGRVDESLCLLAEQMYLTEKCNESCTSSNLNTTAFTMEYSTNNESGVYKKWLKYNKTSQNPSKSAAGSASGVCPLRTSVEKASKDVDGRSPEATAAAASAAQVTAEGQSAGSSSSAASGASSSGQSIGQGTSPADSPAGNASQLPPGGGVGLTDASGTTQTPSATPASGNGGASSAATAAAASQSGKPTHTQETNN
ncbi:mucin-like glycoprotein, putative, partial [Trypanosoma cruzi marinkellei]